MNIAYLAVPYTHPDPEVMEARFRAVTVASAFFFSRGQPVFSPITHNHPVNRITKNPTDFARWEEYDKACIRLLCNDLWVLQLDGWLESVGVKAEIAYATELGIPPRYIPANYVGLSPSFPYSSLGVSYAPLSIP